MDGVVFRQPTTPSLARAARAPGELFRSSSACRRDSLADEAGCVVRVSGAGILSDGGIDADRSREPYRARGCLVIGVLITGICRKPDLEIDIGIAARFADALRATE